MNAAAPVWWTAVAGVCFLFLGAGWADLFLYLTHGAVATITIYLRAHPWSFWGPVIGLEVFLGLLALHLFIEPLIFP